MTELKADADLKNRALPPLAEGMKLAKPEFFMRPTDDKFQLPPGVDYFQYWTTEVSKLSGGRLGATHIKATPAAAGHFGSPWHYHEWDLSMSVIIRGSAEFEFEGVGVVKFEPGMVIFQPAMNRHREVYISPDFWALEINLPAKVPTTFMLPNAENGGWDTSVITM